MTKITIISGFLGAGKTTLIKKLLNGPLRREKTALIENDYGDINIDGRVDVLDAVLLQKHLHGMAPFNGEQAYAADMMSDAAADAFDLAMLKRALLS